MREGRKARGGGGQGRGESNDSRRKGRNVGNDFHRDESFREGGRRVTQTREKVERLWNEIAADLSSLIALSVLALEPPWGLCSRRKSSPRPGGRI